MTFLWLKYHLKLAMEVEKIATTFLALLEIVNGNDFFYFNLVIFVYFFLK